MKQTNKPKNKWQAAIEDFCWKHPAMVLFCSGLAVGLLVGMLF
jgi:hypothetical protein